MENAQQINYAFDRFEIITRRCNLKGKGLEIGPSYNPICPKNKGYDIEILDHLDQEGLRKKYKPYVGELLKNIEPVDYVWNGEDYRDLIGKRKYYDYILASHLIEHTTDFIGFLEQCADLLKDNGILSLVIPNKRYCFDFFRENTSLAQVIDKHRNRQDKHTYGGGYDFFAGRSLLNGGITWNQEILNSNSNFSFCHDKNDIDSFMKKDEFIDIHEWVFTPGSFRVLVNDLWELGFINLCENFFHYDARENNYEFYMSLKKKPVRENKPLNQERRMFLYKYKILEEMEFYYILASNWNKLKK